MNFSNLKTKPKILIGICSPMVLLLVLGAVAVYNINTIVKTGGMVDHTRVVLAEASAIIGSRSGKTLSARLFYRRGNRAGAKGCQRWSWIRLHFAYRRDFPQWIFTPLRR